MTLQNGKCRLCGDIDETVNHMQNKCSKLVQKEYESRHDWVGKMIHSVMFKKLNFSGILRYKWIN